MNQKIIIANYDMDDNSITASFDYGSVGTSYMPDYRSQWLEKSKSHEPVHDEATAQYLSRKFIMCDC